MSRFSIITYIALFCFSSLIAQELCIPSELEATSGNRSIFFSWKDINDNSVENKIFEECFELCTPTGTITHLVDNGNGGWYRGTVCVHTTAIINCSSFIIIICKRISTSVFRPSPKIS